MPISGPTAPLPPSVAAVPEELLRTFSHTKRVGNYLVGRTVGEGSFAKVKEGLHVLTGEKVGYNIIRIHVKKEYSALTLLRRRRLFVDIFLLL